MCIFYVLSPQNGETITELFGPFYTIISSNITDTTITDLNTLFVSNTNYTFEVNETTYTVHMYLYQF